MCYCSLYSCFGQLSLSLMQVMEKPSAVDLKHVTGDLQFCNISFKYEENMPLVLNGLNLHIKAGETVALVGPSGGGKTTLVKLLLRLYDPFSGQLSNLWCLAIKLHHHPIRLSLPLSLFFTPIQQLCSRAWAQWNYETLLYLWCCPWVFFYFFIVFWVYAYSVWNR